MVNVSMGYGSEIGWAGESAYGTAAATTTDAGAGGDDSFFFDSFGIVTDFNLSTVLERHETRGMATQTRNADPILKETYELTINSLWQDDASRGTIYKFLETYEDGTYDSFLIRIMDKPDGSTNEYIYLIGCVLQNYDIKIDVGDVVSVDLTFKCKQIDSDDWQSLIGEDYDNVIDDTTITASLGLTADIVSNMDDNEKIEFASTTGASTDSGKYILVIGLDTDDSTFKTEMIGPLAADNTYVAGSILWSGAAHDIMGVVVLSTNTITSNTTAAGTITVRSETSDTTVATITAGEYGQGVVICDTENALHAGKANDVVVYAVGDAATSGKICVVGTNTSDAALVNGITLNNDTAVASGTAFRNVYYVAYGDIAAADPVRVYTTISSDPTPYYNCSVDFPAGILSIDNQLTSFGLSQSFNPIEIWNFQDSTLKANEQGHKETTFSASVYGDGTSMGASSLFSKLISAGGTGNIVFKIGSNWEYNIVAASYDSLTYPLKEKELIVLDIEGTANSVTLDTQ